jgi:hypothetical protein
MGVSFIIAAGPCQSSHSQVRVPRDPWPYFVTLVIHNVLVVFVYPGALVCTAVFWSVCNCKPCKECAVSISNHRDVGIYGIQRSRRSNLAYFTVSNSRLHQPGGPGPRIYIPRTGWPGYTPRHWVPFSSPHDSQCYGGGIRPRLHTELTRSPQLSSI